MYSKRVKNISKNSIKAVTQSLTLLKHLRHKLYAQRQNQITRYLTQIIYTAHDCFDPKINLNNAEELLVDKLKRNCVLIRC